MRLCDHVQYNLIPTRLLNPTLLAWRRVSLSIEVLMAFEVWLVFVVTEFLLSLVPGPAVLLVVGNGLRFGARRSNWNALGILFTNACYFALSALGLGALLLASRGVFTAVKWLGVLYLVYIGLHMIYEGNKGGETAVSAPATHRTPWQHFVQGALLQAGNPKAILFFVALLPQFVSLETAVAPQLLILGLSSIIVEAFVLFCYGTIAERASQLLIHERAIRWQNWLSGVLLIVAAVGLALIQEG